MWNSYLPPSWRCVLVWEHPCAVCVCERLWWEGWVWGEHRLCLPVGVRQLLPWWKARLDLEGLRPEPGASQSFSSAQLLSQPEVGPKGGKHEFRVPREWGFPWVWWQFVLVWGIPRAWGLGAALLCRFQFSSQLEAGLESGGLASLCPKCGLGGTHLEW